MKAVVKKVFLSVYGEFSVGDEIDLNESQFKTLEELGFVEAKIESKPEKAKKETKPKKVKKETK